MYIYTYVYIYIYMYIHTSTYQGHAPWHATIAKVMKRDVYTQHVLATSVFYVHEHVFGSEILKLSMSEIWLLDSQLHIHECIYLYLHTYRFLPRTLMPPQVCPSLVASQHLCPTDQAPLWETRSHSCGWIDRPPAGQLHDSSEPKFSMF